MESHKLFLIFPLFLLFLAFTTATTTPPIPAPAPAPPPTKPQPGGYGQIQNLSDLHVIEVAKFAVKRHNKQDKNHRFRFMRILDGWSQVVAGINYRLLISCKPRNQRTNQRYLANVYERPWQQFINLTSFYQVVE